MRSKRNSLICCLIPPSAHKARAPRFPPLLIPPHLWLTASQTWSRARCSFWTSSTSSAPRTRSPQRCEPCGGGDGGGGGGRSSLRLGRRRRRRRGGAPAGVPLPSVSQGIRRRVRAALIPDSGKRSIRVLRRPRPTRTRTAALRPRADSPTRIVGSIRVLQHTRAGPGARAGGPGILASGKIRAGPKIFVDGDP